MVTNKL